MHNYIKEYTGVVTGNHNVKITPLSFTRRENSDEFFDADFPAIKYIAAGYTGGLILIDRKPLPLSGLYYAVGNGYIMIEDKGATELHVIDAPVSKGGTGQFYIDKNGNFLKTKPAGDYMAIGLSANNVWQTVEGEKFSQDVFGLNRLSYGEMGGKYSSAEGLSELILDNTIYRKLNTTPLSKASLDTINLDENLLLPGYEATKPDMVIHLLNRKHDYHHKFKEFDLSMRLSDHNPQLILDIPKATGRISMVFRDGVLVWVGRGNKYIFDINTHYGFTHEDRFMFMDDSLERNLSQYEEAKINSTFYVVQHEASNSVVFSGTSEVKGLIIPPQSLFTDYASFDVYINGKCIKYTDWEKGYVKGENSDEGVYCLMFRIGEAAKGDFKFHIIAHKNMPCRKKIITTDIISKFAYGFDTNRAEVYVRGRLINDLLLSYSEYHHMVLADVVGAVMEIHEYTEEYEDGEAFLDQLLLNEEDTLVGYRNSVLKQIPDDMGWYCDENLFSKSQYFLLFINCGEVPVGTTFMNWDTLEEVYGEVIVDPKFMLPYRLVVGGRFAGIETSFDKILIACANLKVTGEPLETVTMRANLTEGLAVTYTGDETRIPFLASSLIIKDNV